MLQASAMHELPQLRVQAHNALDREEAVHDAARHRNPRTVLVVGISNRSLDPGSSLRRASSPCQAVATQTFGARSSTPLPSSWRCRPVAWRGGWSSSPARAAPHHNTTATAVATVEDCRAHTHTHMSPPPRVNKGCGHHSSPQQAGPRSRCCRCYFVLGAGSLAGAVPRAARALAAISHALWCDDGSFLKLYDTAHAMIQRFEQKHPDLAPACRSIVRAKGHEPPTWRIFSRRCFSCPPGLREARTQDVCRRPGSCEKRAILQATRSKMAVPPRSVSPPPQLCTYIYVYTHTYLHTYIHIYIYR